MNKSRSADLERDIDHNRAPKLSATRGQRIGRVGA
jgi:hypothetical protein